MNTISQNKNLLQNFLKIFFLICFLPIFINIESFTFLTEKQLIGDRILSINVLIIPLFIILQYIAIQKTHKIELNYSPFAIICFSTIITFIFFMFFKYQLNVPTSTFFIFFQTILPILFISIFYQTYNYTYSENESLIFLKNKEEILKYFAFSITFTAAILFITKIFYSTGFQLGNDSFLGTQFGPFFNFKGKRFFPILIANASIILIYLFLKDRSKWIYFFAGIFLLICVFNAWSRTALITAMIGIFTLIFAFFKDKGEKIESSSLISFLLIIFPLVLLLFYILYINLMSLNVDVGSANSFIRLFYGLFSSQSLTTVSDESIRLARMTEGLQLVLSNPLGLGFEQSNQDSAMNYSYYINLNTKNFVSENGYIDFALKTGWIGIGILLNSLYKIHYFFKTHNHKELTLLKSLFYANVISSIFLLHILTEPYSSFLIWFILVSCYFLLNFKYD
mgnify:CR=1 FL=1|tara:strand:- start:9482 stop:10837 length:1356 start_codon:yes stop_codon:yes gene_type:complete